MLQQQIEKLADGEACLIADFKENIRVPYSKDQVGHDFFHNAPVTLISFVTYTWNATAGRSKNIFTVLSRCLTHNAQFVIVALRRVLEEPLFARVKLLHWWSDGGSHFFNKQLQDALLHPELQLGRKFDVEMNIFEAHHGKNDCDSVFGAYSSLMRHNVPSSGFRSFSHLLDFFSKVTQPLPHTSSPDRPSHTFLTFVPSALVLPMSVFQSRSLVIR
jgi:hypothetical protein